MASPPARTEISDNYPLPSDATARIGFGKLYDYVTGLLGATGNALEARAALGAYGKNNILGTVSQSAGVPTGAVIERGSNANGEYVRFADGTQICTGSFAFAGSAWKSGSPLVTFASTFINSSFYLALTPKTDATSYAAVAVIDTTYSTSGVDFKLRAPNGIADAGTSLTAAYTAVGRWF